MKSLTAKISQAVYIQCGEIPRRVIIDRGPDRSLVTCLFERGYVESDYVNELIDGKAGRDGMAFIAVDVAARRTLLKKKWLSK